MIRKFIPAMFVATGLVVWGSIAGSDEKPVVKKHEDYTEKITIETDNNGKKEKVETAFKMVAIPAGSFMMGSPTTEKGRAVHEGPQIKVAVKAFWMGKHEVTWDEYDLYWRFNNSALKVEEGEKPLAKSNDPADAITKPTSPYVDETYNHERDKHPAICMTHHACMKYCEWLSKKTGKYYRLPTEAEWEYACRAGTTSPWGIPEKADIADYAWYGGNSKDNDHPRGTTHDVGKKKANAFGLHDMHGNVMEWTLDHYVADAYGRWAKIGMAGDLIRNPVFKPMDKKWKHVARGGHFKDPPEDLRSASRRPSDKEWMKHDPQIPQSIWWLTNYDTIGFRIVRPVADDELKALTSKLDKDNDETFKP